MMKQLMTILTALSLTVFLSACQSVPETQTETVVVSEPVYIFPDPLWMQDCVKPQLKGNKTESLVQFYFDALTAIEKCNEDKKALREWSKEKSPDNQSGQ